MRQLNRPRSVLFLFVLVLSEIKCKCRHSYMTFCDDLDDLANNKVENWTELVVGTESADSSLLRAVNYDSLQLDRFERLTTLIIIRQIKDLKTYTFSLDPEDTKVEHLQLYGNEIKRLRFTTFDNMVLRKLSLVNNNIEYIHKGAFYNCEIRTIDLSDNKIEMIEGEVFTEEFLSNGTKELVLRNNKLEAIAPHSFPSSLEILNLDYNNLNYIDPKAFDNLENLQELTLSHNKISSVPASLKNLKNIIVIDASHNNILFFDIRYFNELSQLEVLDFSYNEITYPQTFQKFNFPQRHPPLQISLAFNQLTHLVICDNSFRDHIVILYGNPWNCMCWEILEKFMVDNKVKRDECDLRFFGNGEVPYCIHYPGNNCTQTKILKNPDFTEKDLQDFQKIVEGSRKTVNCPLKPRRL